MARGQNLLSKVYNKPLLITHTDLQPIADYLSNPERAASLRFDTVVENTPKLADLIQKIYTEKLFFNTTTSIQIP